VAGSDFIRKRLWPHASDAQWRAPGWQWSNRLRGKRGLGRLFWLSEEAIEELARVIEEYPWATTPYYLNLISSPGLDDPILRQILPSRQELVAGGCHSSPDPLHEHDFMPVEGLIHRYPDRCLLLSSHLCAVHCRHCNRKRTWRRPEAIFRRQQWRKALSYIEANSQIREVILSGGDPLALSRRRLYWILSSIRAIGHVEVIRIGTRLPVTLPFAVDDGLAGLLGQFSPIWVNTHFNHASEITPEAEQACRRLQLAGIPVSNQAVLLRGVNDSFTAVKELCTRLQAMMVRPYYLFQCDTVMGCEHFRTPLSAGIAIIDRMWCRVGGMCVPRFVVDLPNGRGKAVAAPASLLHYEDGKALFRTFQGEKVWYHDPKSAE